MPADATLVTELIIDAAGALAGAAEFEAASDRIVAASTRAAAASDRLGGSVVASSTATATSTSSAATAQTAASRSVEAAVAAQEAALLRQSAAAGGSVGALEKLTRVSKDVELAQQAVAARIASGALTATAGQAELAKLAARHEELAAASEKLSTGSATLTGVLAQYPNLLSAIGSAASKSAGNHAELAESFEKFRTGAIPASALIQQFPALLGAAGNEAKVLASRYDELAATLVKYHAGQVSAAAVTAAFPGLVSAAGNEIDKLSQHHAQLLINLEKFRSGQMDVATLLTAYPQIVGQTTSSFEKLIKAQAETAAAVAGVGVAHKAAVAGIEEFDHASEHATMTIRQQHGVMATIRALIVGDYNQALSSGTLSLERFHFFHIALQPAILGTIAVLTAMASVVVAVAVHVFEAEQTLRSFNLILSTVANTGSSITGSGLLALRDQLRDTGTSAADAEKAIASVLLAAPRGVSPAAVRTIVPLARDIGAVTGTSTVEETKKLTDALAGGVHEMINFGFALGAISAPQAAAMRQLEEHGRAADAMRIAIDALTAKFGGDYERSLSNADKLWIALKKDWNALLESLGETGVFQFLIDKLRELTVVLKDTFGTPEKIRDFFKPITDTFATTAKEIKGITDFWNSLHWEGQAAQAAEAARNAPPAATGVLVSGVLATAAAVAASAPATTEADAAREDLIKAMRERGSTEEEIQKMIGGQVEAQAINTQAIKDLTTAVQTAAAKAPTLIAGGEAGIGNVTAINAGIANAAGFGAGAGGISGKVSWFGPWPGHPEWADAMNAGQPNASGAPLSTPGIALYNRSTLGQLFLVSGPDGREFLLPQVDIGPAPSTGKSIDINAPAAAAMGFTPNTFPTGAVFSARPLLDVGAGLGGASTITDQTALINATAAQTDAVNKKAEADRKELVVTGQVGAQRIIAEAQLNAEKRATELHLQGQERENFISGELATAKTKLNQQYSQGADLAGLEATGQLRTADGYRQSAVEGLRASAMLQAQILHRNTGISVEQAYNQIINKNATDAIAASAQQLAATNVTAAGTARLAEAASHGTAALHAQELANEAITRSQDEVNKATLTGNQGLIDRATAQQAALLATLRDNEAQKETLALRTSINQSQDRRDVTALELSLQGNTTEQIRGQVTLLEAQLRIKNDASLANEKDKQAYLDEVRAQIALNLQLAEAERAQQRINDAVRSVADTIDNQLVSALDDAFSGKKVEDWGVTLKKILQDILKQIVEFTLIKPAIGTALEAAGLGTVAQQFGSFGNLFGGTSSGGGIGNLFGGIGKLLGIGGGGGPSDFIIPGTDTALSALQGPTITGATLGESLLGSGGGGFLGGLFSNGGALGGIGSLFSEGGALGGIGSLFSAISPVIPFVGPIAGIASLVGGIFGGGRPSNNAAGADLNLATGVVSRVATSPDASSNQSVQQITQALQQFGQQITQLTGVPSSALVAIQAGVRDGIKVDFGGSLSGQGQQKFGDATTAINQIELDIAHHMEGVSDTLKTVLAHVTDPKDIQNAISFALAYDNLKKAADNAFSSISTDTGKIGPFATAMATISSTFTDLANKANQFGLSLAPINAGLAEATRRLQGDFQQSLDQLLNTGSSTGFINDLITASNLFASNTREAQAIGLGSDQTTLGKIKQIESLQAGNILNPLTADQLQKVVTTLGQSNPEIAAMAQAILDAGGAATGAATAVTDLKTGLTNLHAAITELTTGKTLSGLTASGLARASLNTYQTELAAVQAGNTGEVSNLAKSATDLIAAYQTAFGNAPQTAAIRNQVVGQLNTVVNSPALLAAATTTGGSAAQGLIVGSAAVQSAQSAALMAALAATPAAAKVAASATPAAAAAPAALPAATPAAATIENVVNDLNARGADSSGGGDTSGASGFVSTPPGWITVGEEGPEYIGYGSSARPSLGTENVYPLIRAGMRDLSRLAPGSGWVEVGLRGPERIFQPGGATVLPHGVLPRFAAGTSYASSSSDGSLVSELRELRGEVAALRRQTQGGQTQASQEARLGNTHLADISRKVGPGIVQPERRKVG